MNGGMMVGMATTHIPEGEAVRDLPSLLARVRAGEEIVIENESAPPVVLRVVAEGAVRRLSDSLQMAKEAQVKVTLDSAFPGDLKAVIDSHDESLKNPWD